MTPPILSVHPKKKKKSGIHASGFIGVRNCDVLSPPRGGRGLKIKKILRHVKKQISVAIQESQNGMNISITVGVLARFVEWGRGGFEIDEKNSQKKITRILKNS